ncbi:histone-lysine n-methyltransferase [Quercus suber]|uniref:Histone-lysine n-methyltransferase n=1 Tax=Quercus suber TaxID=58331 RepID=A0AAW0MA30_QUESU
MAILRKLGDDLLACNQNKVLADDRKNIAQCIKKIEPKTPLRRSLRLQNMQGRVSPRLQEKSDEQKISYGSKRKRLSDDLKDQVSKKETEVVPVEDIGCRSDLETGCNNAGDARVVSDSMRVTMTLRDFDTLYLRFVQNGNACDGHAKRCTRRPDLKAISEASINVGHQFSSRAAMVAVGLHGQCLRGIDYTGESSKVVGYLKQKKEEIMLPVAVSIVLSGQYEDDVDKSEEVEYTGEGGNDLLGNKCQVKDQVMCRGNLALRNNIDQGLPVRVIRGHKCVVGGHPRKIYTYDGLYKVEHTYEFKVDHYREERGASGFNVFKYHLTRITDQPKLFSRLVCMDISGGEEKIRIAATNVLNMSSLLKLQKILGEPRDVVFECGPNCCCGLGCLNRRSQQGLNYELEVYRTKDKGWAVRSRDFIPSGAPVCEYGGILRKSDELDNVSENDYIFDIDCLQTMRGIGGRERRFRNVSIPSSNHAKKRDDHISETGPEFCIDAGTSGNVARFINHSCEPNLYVQCVLSSHYDARLARVVLFAADNIFPMKELTYDYGYQLDSVVGPDGKIKEFPCYCGAANCRKRLY